MQDKCRKNPDPPADRLPQLRQTAPGEFAGRAIAILIMAERGWPSRSASPCEDTHPQYGIRACCGWASRAPP